MRSTLLFRTATVLAMAHLGCGGADEGNIDQFKGPSGGAGTGGLAAGTGGASATGGAAGATTGKGGAGMSATGGATSMALVAECNSKCLSGCASA